MWDRALRPCYDFDPGDRDLTDFITQLSAIVLIGAGALLFIGGGVLDLTGIGLPVGIGVDALGIILMLGGAALLGVGPMRREQDG